MVISIGLYWRSVLYWLRFFLLLKILDRRKKKSRSNLQNLGVLLCKLLMSRHPQCIVKVICYPLCTVKVFCFPPCTVKVLWYPSCTVKVYRRPPYTVKVCWCRLELFHKLQRQWLQRRSELWNGLTIGWWPGCPCCCGSVVPCASLWHIDTMTGNHWFPCFGYSTLHYLGIELYSSKLPCTPTCHYWT